MDDERDSLIADLVERGRRRWPRLTEHADAFYERLRLLVAGLSAEDVERLHAEDLFLAFACLRHDAIAISELERTVVDRIPMFVRKLGLSSSAIDELKEDVRIKLIMSESDAPPKLEQYRGSGSLDSWVCAVSIHAALAYHRRAAREQVDLCDNLEQVIWEANEALSLARLQLTDIVSEVLRDVLLSLSSSERILLRMYYVERLTYRQIGRIYAVHYATAKRRIDALVERITTNLKAAIQQRTSMSATEIESIGRVLGDQVNLSIARILGS
jgi:RNA polymerase sigma-70 factor (ECF subfamily)